MVILLLHNNNYSVIYIYFNCLKNLFVIFINNNNKYSFYIYRLKGHVLKKVSQKHFSLVNIV